MIKQGHIILALLLLLAIVGELSQRPSPSAGEYNRPPPSQAQANQQQSTDGRGTEQSPFVIRTIKSKEETAEDRADRQAKTFDDHVTWFLSAAVAVGTLLQFGALIVIILTTRNQLRAYVMIESVAIVGIAEGRKPDVHITIKNSGQTPARNVTHWSKLGFSTFPEIAEPVPRRDSDETLPESTMAPGGTLGIITGIDRELNAATIKAIKDQSYALYVLGEIRYTDAFGKHRETDFLLFCTGHLADSGSAASYKKGNRIT